MQTGKFSEDDIKKLARSAYEEGSAGFEIFPERTALLIIDMQDEFVKPHWTPYWIPEATGQAPVIKKVLNICREKGVPVIYTLFSRTNYFLDRPYSGRFMSNRYADLDIDQKEFYNGEKIWHELTPEPGEVVIHKPSYGAFYDTPLQTILRNLDKDTVIIAGTLTNYCCGLTARQAYERGFKVIFGSDINSTDDPGMQEHELKILRRGFAKVMSSGEIIKFLNG